MFSILNLVALSLCAVAFAQEAPLVKEDVESRLRLAIEGMRDLMSTGYPALGIPPLDPFEVEKFSYELAETTLKVKFNANKIKISNAKRFIIQNVAFTNYPLGASFQLYFPNIAVTADQYSMNGRVMVFFPIKSSGKMRVDLIGVKVGVVVKVALVNESSLYLEDIGVDIDVGSIEADLENASSMVNSVISNYGASMINGKKSSFAEAIREQLVPPINEFLSQVTYQDIVKRLR